MSVTDYWIRNKSDEAAIDEGCYFDIKAADHVRQFCFRFLRHSKGHFAGKPFELLDWQWDRVIAPAFGWKMSDGTRRFRKVGIGIPKKNGKSTLLSGLALYHLIADKEAGAEVYSAAADRMQASIIYKEAANMVEVSPMLAARLKVRRSLNTIEHKASKSIYKALSAEANTKEGLNISALLFDELHAQKDRILWDTLRYGGAARRQPLFWWISTAGEADDTLLWSQEWAHCRKIQESKAIDIGYLAAIWEAGKEDDWTKEETWAKANPSYHSTLNKREMKEECKSAQLNGVDKVAFLRYRLNIATAATSEWIAKEHWDACRDDFDLASLKGATLYSALDLASTTDLIAYVLVFKKKDDVYLWPYFWVPKREIDAREQGNKQKYNEWEQQGYLKVTSEEPVADYKVITRDVAKICKKLAPTTAIIDRWNATQLAYDLRKLLKKNAIDTKVQFATFNTHTASAATKELGRLILSGRLHHPGNPVLDWMFSNVIVRQDALGNVFPDKAKSKDKIDGIVAAVLALAVMIEEQKQASRYEKKGIESAEEASS
jgi:phage terminase large subunit-like protein